MLRDPATLAPAEARAAFRAGLRTPTSGWAEGYAQLNLVVVPEEHAADFRRFAEQNSRSCPLVEMTDAGSFRTSLAPDADLRTDLPSYRVFVDGEPRDEVDDITPLWRDDLVAFLIGCSFTFEAGLQEGGVPIRHREAERNVPMYRTSLPAVPSGPFRGSRVVSMRPIPSGMIERAVEISAEYPEMHGAPIHVGDPAEIGIADLDRPEYGDPPVAREGDVPVFWECGVTPQEALLAARIPFAITHSPGMMFVSDAPHARWRVPGGRP